MWEEECAPRCVLRVPKEQFLLFSNNPVVTLQSLLSHVSILFHLSLVWERNSIDSLQKRISNRLFFFLSVNGRVLRQLEGFDMTSVRKMRAFAQINKVSDSIYTCLRHDFVLNNLNFERIVAEHIQCLLLRYFKPFKLVLRLDNLCNKLL